MSFTFPETVHPVPDVAAQKSYDGEKEPGGKLQHQSRLKNGISIQAGNEEFYIPASVTQISGRGDGLFARYPKAQELFGVFEPKMMLKVVRGSVAHRYASKMKIRFEFV